jgi:hypothetical protein
MKRWKCFPVETKKAGECRCEECSWKVTLKDLPIGEMQGAVFEHVSKTGHAVVRTYRSKTLYRADEPAEVKESPRVRAWCKTCDKEIGEKAKNIVLFWAASSHRKKTGHVLEIIEKDGTRRPL